MRSDDGFTLVEILIAIVLVGILSAVVVVGISNLTSKGPSAACATSADAATAGSAIYFTSYQSYEREKSRRMMPYCGQAQREPPLKLAAEARVLAVLRVKVPRLTIEQGRIAPAVCAV